jgi:hypothetical protein
MPRIEAFEWELVAGGAIVARGWCRGTTDNTSHT